MQLATKWLHNYGFLQWIQRCGFEPFAGLALKTPLNLAVNGYLVIWVGDSEIRCNTIHITTLCAIGYRNV